VALGIETAVEQPLGEHECLGGRLGEAVGPLGGGGLQVGGGNDLVDQTDALGLIGAEVVAEEDELLRLVQADEPREHVGAAAVGGDAPAHEHLDELRIVGGDEKVGGKRDVRADPCGGAVDRDDDRLLAIHDRGDQALGAALDVAADVAEGLLGCIVGARVDGYDTDAQVRAGAEMALTGGGDQDTADVEIVAGTLEERDRAVALIGGDGVGRIGTVQREPGHAVPVDVPQEIFVVGVRGGVGHGARSTRRGMWRTPVWRLLRVHSTRPRGSITANAANSSANITVISSRARLAPRQWWIP
jgi:hypothetical protein